MEAEGLDVEYHCRVWGGFLIFLAAEEVKPLQLSVLLPRLGVTAHRREHLAVFSRRDLVGATGSDSRDQPHSLVACVERPTAGGRHLGSS